MVLKLYTGVYAGGGAVLVALILAEKNIPFEHVLVDMAKGENKTPEFLAKHPFGQVPVIDDDGFILCESRAICRYLAEKYADKGTALVPMHLKEKALFEQAASFEFANFHPHAMPATLMILKREKESNLALFKDTVSKLSATLDVYEVILGKQKFLAGNEPTLVDLFHLPYAGVVAGMEDDIMANRGPNVTRWWNDLTQRPTWLKLRKDGVKSTGN
ncbi:glutathione S-transferase [Mycena rebaudengoi]|nr:glutathione S-transferase [Mycena rebaudengoi]